MNFDRLIAVATCTATVVYTIVAVLLTYINSRVKK